MTKLKKAQKRGLLDENTEDQIFLWSKLKKDSCLLLGLSNDLLVTETSVQWSFTDFSKQH